MVASSVLTDLKGSPDGDQVYFDLPGVAMVRWDSPSQSAYIEWQGWAIA